MMKWVFAVLGSFAIADIHAQAALQFTGKQAHEDIIYLFQQIEETHPDLFFRCTEKDYTLAKNSLISKYSSAASSVATVAQLNQDISLFLNRIHDGHTNSQVSDTANQLRMPFETKLVANRLFIDKILEKSMKVAGKDEIIAVNNAPVFDYLDNRTKYKSFEIYETALDSVARAFPFKRQHIDSDNMRLTIRKQDDGSQYEETVRWGKFGTRKHDMVFLYKPFEFKYLADIGAGYISWNLFFDRKVCEIYLKNGTLKDTKITQEQVPDWESFLHDIFNTLREKNAGYLIIDLRNNTGGNSTLGKNLIAFLTDKKIKDYDGYIKLSPLLKKTYGDRFRKIFDTYPIGAKVTDSQQEEISGEESVFKELELRKKPESRFAGKVILLTAYSTYSAAETFTVLMKDNALGTVVGEPTGNGGNGPIDTLKFNLPNSKIEVHVSFAFRIRPDTDEKCAKQVEPNIRVSQTVSDYLNNRDTVLELVKQMILDRKI